MGRRSSKGDGRDLDAVPTRTGRLVSGTRWIKGQVSAEERRPWIQAIAAVVLEEALRRWEAARDAAPAADGTLTAAQPDPSGGRRG